MSLVLQLPQELERQLSHRAAELGLSLAEYATRILANDGRSETATAASLPARTGADLVAHWQREALVGTRPDIADSQAYARELRARAEKRER